MISFTNNIFRLVLIVVILSLPLQVILSQDQTIFAEEKRTDGTFANMFHFTFKPGKTDEGLEILRSSLLPAFQQSEIKVTLIEDLLGTKDVMLIVPLEQGPEYYAYKMPQQDVRIWSSLLQLSGSAEKSEAQLDRFIELLEEQSQTLVFIPD